MVAARRFHRWGERCAAPLRKAAAEEHRRVAKRGVQGGVDTAAWLALVAAADGVRTYCGASQPLTMDHRVPLSRGGRHEIANLIPACKPCNSRKHTRTEEELRALLDSERGLSEEERSYRAPPWVHARTCVSQIATWSVRRGDILVA